MLPVPSIVLETPDFLIIDKPAGQNFHREGAEPGIVELADALVDGNKLFPVHRLDRDTSGLLILARSSAAAAALAALFRERRIEKYYLALSDRKPSRKQGLIKGDMEKARRGDWRLSKTLNNPAFTRFLTFSVSPGLRLFVLKPLTGRTHQLRVAMKSLGAPVLGDERYYPKNAASMTSPEQRLYLHAFALAFPWQGAMVRVVCPPRHGERFTSGACATLIATLGSPWDLPWPGSRQADDGEVGRQTKAEDETDD